MTDKEKLEKLNKLADAMYYTAQYLTTDASRLHKAMNEYHQFIINEYHKEEPINYDKLNTMLDDALAKETKESLNERLGISQEEYGKIVDGCLYGKEPELVDVDDLPKEEPVNNDFEMALAEMIDKAQTSVVEPLMIAAQWKDELIKLAKSEEPVSEQNLSNVQRTVKNWKEEPVSDDLEEACEQLAEKARMRKAETISPFFSQTDYKQGVIDGAKWQKEQFEKNRLKHCNSITNEQAELEQGFIDQHLDKYNRMPTFLDAIEYGMRLQKEQMMAKAIDASCFGFQSAALFSFRLPADKYLVGSEVKIIVVKED